MTTERPTTTCEACGQPVSVEGHTTLHYEPAEPSGLTVDDIPAHPRNVQRAYRSDEFNAERERPAAVGSGAMSEQLYTCIARCRVCGRELNRAEHVPQSERGRVAMAAPMIALCPERSHNTFSDLNLAVDLEWVEEEVA